MYRFDSFSHGFILGCQRWCFLSLCWSCLSWQQCQGTQTLQLFSQVFSFPREWAVGMTLPSQPTLLLLLVIPGLSAHVGKDVFGIWTDKQPEWESAWECPRLFKWSLEEKQVHPWWSDSKGISLRAQRWCSGSSLCSMQGHSLWGWCWSWLRGACGVSEHWAAVQAAQLCWQALFDCDV